jgi:alpha-beta hydrolase superfamily lysophospholipase
MVRQIELVNFYRIRFKVKRVEGYFRGHNDFELFYQSWTIEKPKGIMIVTHGLGEHSECYQRLVEGIAPLEFSVYAWDLRGHGRSEGKRGVSRDFFDFCKDLESFIRFVKKKEPELPVFQIGHSMGGLVVANALLKGIGSDLRGTIFSSPLFEVGLEVPKLKEMAGNVVSKWLPDLTLNNQIEYAQLSRDESVIDEYEKDHLRHDKVSTKLFSDMLESIKFALDHAVQIQVATLIQQAGHDTVVGVNGTRTFFSKLSSEDKTFLLYEGYLHEIYNDLGRERVYSDLMNWVNAHL